MAVVKSPFVLVTDDARRFEFDAGEQDIPAEIADHWYVRAHLEPVAYDEPAQSAESPEPQAQPSEEAPQTSKRKAK